VQTGCGQRDHTFSALASKNQAIRKSYAVESPGNYIASQEIEKEEFKKDGRKTTLGQIDDAVHPGGLEDDSMDYVMSKDPYHQRRLTNDRSGAYKDVSQLKLQTNSMS
jgi:hypothetical protein